MTTYLPRSAWTSTSAAGATLTGIELVGVADHWPGTTQAAIGDPGQEKIAERLRSYRNFHVNGRGWSDIGYNIAIDQGGRVWMLRSTQWRGNRVGAHCASATNPRANHRYVGVLLIIGQSETPSAKMVAAHQDWFHDKFLPGWPGRRDVRPHKRVPGALTNCCGTRATALIDNGTLTAKPVPIPTPPPAPEDDMPYRDWPQADKDALLQDISDAVLGRKYPEYIDPDGDGKREPITVSHALFEIHKNTWKPDPANP